MTISTFGIVVGCIGVTVLLFIAFDLWCDYTSEDHDGY